MEQKTIELLVPCYNEQEAIPLFYQEFVTIAEQLSAYDLQVLFINDGSKDESLAAMRQLAQTDKRIGFISFSRNFGKESAMYAGLMNADADYVAIMDVDLQDPITLLPEMVEILEGGVRFCSHKKSLTRR